MVLSSSLELIEALHPTPLVKLPKISEYHVGIWAKLEFFNPFSRSIKDRAAISMLSGAMRRTGATRFYEATSGNLGVALAALAAAHGVRFRAYVPRSAAGAAVSLMRILGAEVVVGDSEGVDDGLVEAARRDAERDGAVFLDQYHNEDNPRGQGTLAAELREQFRAAGLRPVAVVSGTGSLGHLTALGELRDELGFSLVAARPAEGERIPGLRRDWKRRMVADLVVDVTLRESIEAALRVARMEGLAVGVSSGAALAAAEAAAEDLGPGDYVVIFPDDALKYIDLYEAHMSPTRAPLSLR
ncbi:MAG: pyridoxal-phosphate dependent enzyme [Nitrososphaeria archaeon]|jgi:cysteine synthase A